MNRVFGVSLFGPSSFGLFGVPLSSARAEKNAFPRRSKSNEWHVMDTCSTEKMSSSATVDKAAGSVGTLMTTGYSRIRSSTSTNYVETLETRIHKFGEHLRRSTRGLKGATILNVSRFLVSLCFFLLFLDRDS